MSAHDSVNVKSCSISRAVFNDEPDNNNTSNELQTPSRCFKTVASERSFLDVLRTRFTKTDINLLRNSEVCIDSPDNVYSKKRKRSPFQKSRPEFNFRDDLSATSNIVCQKKFRSVSDSMIQLSGKVHLKYQNLLRRNLSSSKSMHDSDLSSSSYSDTVYSSCVTFSSEHSTSSSSSSNSDLSPPEPPDGGWGWVIVIAAFFVHMITDGVPLSFGIFLEDLFEDFDTSLSVTSWVGSFAYGIPCLAAPVAAVFINKYGCRKVCIAGGFISGAGCVLSFFSKSMFGLILTFGVLCGLGSSLSSTAALIIVSLYFDDRRATATGLSLAGSGVGAFTFAPLVYGLISLYTWRGAMLILSGIFANLIVCGSLMRPIETHKERRKRQLLVCMENFAKESGFKLPQIYLKSIQRHTEFRIQLLKKLLTNPVSLSSSNSSSTSSLSACKRANFDLTRISMDDPVCVEKKKCKIMPKVLFTADGDIDISKHNSFPVSLNKNYNIYSQNKFVPSTAAIAESDFGRRPTNSRNLSSVNKFEKHNIYRYNTISVPNMIRSSWPIDISADCLCSTALRRRFGIDVNRKHFFSIIRNGNTDASICDKEDNFTNEKNTHICRLCSDPEIFSFFFEKYHIDFMNNKLLAPCACSQGRTNTRNFLALNRSEVKQNFAVNTDQTIHQNHQLEDAYFSKKFQKNTALGLSFSHPAQQHSNLSALRNSLAHIYPLYSRTKRSIYHRSTLFQASTANQLRTVLSMPDLVSTNKAGSRSSSYYDLSGNEYSLRKCSYCRLLKSMMCRHINYCVDTSLFHSKNFDIFLISNLLLYFWCNVTYFFLALDALKKGVSNTLAPILFSSLGAAGMFGQIVYGWAADQKWFNTLLLYVSAVLICGVTTMLAPLAYTFTLLLSYSIIFGFTMAANDSLCTILVIEFVGLSRLVSALGFCLFCQGIVCILGPPLIGFIIDSTGSNTVAFIVCGTGVILAALVMIPVVVREQRRAFAKRRRRQFQLQKAPQE